VQPPEELGLPEPEVDLDFEDAEIDDDEFSDLADSLASIPDMEETYTVFWDDLEDLDEFDEQAQRAHPEQLPAEQTITREMRARQIAAEILLECDWPASAIDLLQQVFIENGWSMTRVAVERELDKGLLPYELELAMAVRHFWSENPCFWTTYQRIKSNAPCMYAAAAYRHMSWAEALRIVRCFSSLPDAEEVTVLIEDTYDWWYSDDAFRRRFKSFLEFLRYRAGSMPGTLPGQCFFDFAAASDNE
jgi:hypothetical protein